MKRRNTIVFVATLVLCTSASGQFDSRNSIQNTPADCLQAKAVRSSDLYGRWEALLAAPESGAGTAAATAATVQASVTFQPHPDTDGALSGRIVRPRADGAAAESVLAGGVGDGAFGIEESADGKAISGIWNGDVVPGSCGREIRGTFVDPGDDSERGFVLRRSTGQW